MTLEVGWRGVYGAVPDEPRAGSSDDEEERGELPPLEPGQPVRCVEAESEKRTTKPPPRFNEATLLSAMETAGKLVDDEALREAMKERGLGTPATRAEIIETLIRREYVERHGKDLTPTPQGPAGHHAARHPPADLGRADRRLGAAPERDRAGPASTARASCAASPTSPARRSSRSPAWSPATSGRSGPSWGRAPAAAPRPARSIRENSKAYGCTSWKSKEEPGCGFVIWKQVAGRTLDPGRWRASSWNTAAPAEVLAGFQSRAGKPFRARLLLDADGKVTFDMPARPGGGRPAARRIRPGG